MQEAGNAHAATLIRAGDVGGVREALARGSPLPGLLHVAAEEGHAEVIEMLIEAGAPPSEVDEDGQTALHSAVANGNVEAAEVLSRAQPCLELLVADKYKMTPLHLACEADEPEMLALILARGGDEIMQERRRESIISRRASIADEDSESGTHPVTELSHRWSTSTDGSFGYIARRHSNAEGAEMLRRASRGHATQLPSRLSEADPAR